MSTVLPGRCLGWSSAAGEVVMTSAESPDALLFIDYADLNRWIALRGARVRVLAREHRVELRAAPS